MGLFRQTDSSTYNAYSGHTLQLPEEGWAVDLNTTKSKRALVDILATSGRDPYTSHHSVENKTVAWDRTHYWYVWTSKQPKISNTHINSIIKNHKENGSKQRDGVHQSNESQSRKRNGKGLRVPKRTKQIANTKRLAGNETRSIQRKKEIRQRALKGCSLLGHYNCRQTGRS